MAAMIVRILVCALLIGAAVAIVLNTGAPKDVRFAGVILGVFGIVALLFGKL